MSDAATILVVDDDNFVRVLVKDVLSQHGHTIVEAADGAEALERYREARPQLVLIDLMMPNKSGMEALRDLRALDPKSRVLVMSTLDSDSLVQAALEQGATDFVVKPFHPLELSDAVTRALRRV